MISKQKECLQEHRKGQLYHGLDLNHKKETFS